MNRNAKATAALATYAKTLFLIDSDATVGGVAGGLADLNSLGARNVDAVRTAAPALALPLDQIAAMGRDSDASLLVVGVPDTMSLYRAGIVGRAAMPDLPLLYLGVNSPDGALLPTPGRVLRHVLVPGDYSVRSGCLSSCLTRIAQRGSRIVTLMHVPDASLASGCAHPAVGEIGRIDTDWIEHLKAMLFSAGVDEVRLITPANGDPEFDDLSPRVTLVLVGSTCNSEIAQAYVSAAGRHFAHHDEVPALMLTAESCAAAARARGAA